MRRMVAARQEIYVKLERDPSVLAVFEMLKTIFKFLSTDSKVFDGMSLLNPKTEVTKPKRLKHSGAKSDVRPKT